MDFIITLHLNEIGCKALGVNEKTISINAENKDSLTNAMIDEVFPLTLIKSYDIKPSFANNPVGSYVAVVKDGVRYLGEILNPDPYYKNRIRVKLYSYEPNVTYTETIEFHPNGVEVTHNKNKYCLDSISDVEVENIKAKLKNKPFIKMLSMLLGKDDVTINGKTPDTPEWLTTETIERITNFLDSDFYSYYND